MKSWQRLFSVLVALGTVAQDLYAMEFDFRPLSSLCRIEVNLATGFGSGTIRGTFGKMKGTLFFSPENPQQTEGRILLASRSLRFGYPKVGFRYPKISFRCPKISFRRVSRSQIPF